MGTFGLAVREDLRAGGGLVVQSGVCHSDPGTHGNESSVKLPSPTIPGSSGMYVGDSLAGSQPWRLDRPSPTVVTTEAKGSGPGAATERVHKASDALYLATGRRRLTVEECATLQGFPSGHPFQGTKSAQYRQVGNAVPPKLAEVVGRAVFEAAK